MKFFKNINQGLKVLIPEVGKVLELILVLAATTSTAERCFSRLKLIKTPLRSTLTQEHLNHFMMLALNPMVDNLSTEKIAELFISRCNNNTRKKMFGKIKKIDFKYLSLMLLICVYLIKSISGGEGLKK